MCAKKSKEVTPRQSEFPLLKSAEEMSKISGIGENRLRELMEQGELEYLQNGNRRLLTIEAIWDYYRRHKTPVKTQIRPLVAVQTEYQTNYPILNFMAKSGAKGF